MPLQFCEFSDSLWTDVQKTTRISSYIEHYVKEYSQNGEIVLLIEDNYIDKDFLIDYSFYYSRCFEDLSKKVKRIHFFKCNKLTLVSLFNDILDNPQNDNEKKEEELNKLYIGFTTIKPINERSTGRSIFKPYPEKDGNNDLRHFPIYNKYTINIAGIDLFLEALPFQEQDHNVAACATTAIWVALHGLKRIFDNGNYYSQYEITNMAFDAFGNMGNRKFPNEGLHDFQILNLIQKIGYDTIYYKLESQSNWFIDNLIKSHLDMGIPLLAFLQIAEEIKTEDDHTKTPNSPNTNEKEPTKKDKKYKIAGHLVTISGYKTANSSNKLIELYIHDDQIGFNSKVTFYNDIHTNWKNEWITQKGKAIVTLTSIIAPVYHKIRIPFSSVYSILKLSIKTEPDERYSIHLFTISMFRKFLKSHHSVFGAGFEIYVNDILKEYKLRGLLEEMLPKYLWCVKIQNQEKVIFFVFDATSYTLNPIIKIYSQDSTI